jgi:transposase
LGSDGPAGLIHGNRGRRPSNAVSAVITARVIELATTTYRGFNQQHLTEMLAEHEGIDLSRSSVRRILSSAGVPAVRRRRPPRHRSRRDR